ncbi:NAD(P) transhydrogenase subunit alpha [Sphingomonas zeae]|jgi:NAD(P) transhydrogenase subunit alpha
MTMLIAIVKETEPDERRVAITPPTLAKLLRLGVTVAIETGAGQAAGFADAAYQGASIAASAADAVREADIVMTVRPAAPTLVAAMKPGAILLGFVEAPDHADLVSALRENRITALAMEKVPRISRAQAIDALSSQAALAGYYAPLLGAAHLPRILPMMTTAVGSLRAARVLVMGLGVAGLQALATAHRLGAVTSGYDVRPETAEQARSLGAKFVETGVDARAEGGYARPLTDVEHATVREALTRYIAEADLIVTTAAVPGRKAPRLIDRSQVLAMKPGSVIVDLAADSGGNVEGTLPGETVIVGPTTILAPRNVPSRLAEHASELYARNLLAMLGLLIEQGSLKLDMADEIVSAMRVRPDGADGDTTPGSAALTGEAA